ncbi:MAG: N-acetyltransferase [Nitrospirae bacterium]|nr:N-acetyltransferase [Nitrospirota bacterium]
MKGARIGKDCNIGEHCYVESGVVVGDHVTVKNGVALWEGVTVEDGAFLGPFAVFTNDRRPRSMPGFKTPREEFLPTHVSRGATIGANATIVCGVKIGEWSFVAAGAVVHRDVEPYALVAGNPATRKGYVCRCNRRMTPGKPCACGARYARRSGAIRIVRNPVSGRC